MPIRKGEPWGEPGPLPRHGVVVSSDDEAMDIVTAARRANEPIPPLGLVGGDLCRTLGGRGDRERLRSDEAMTFPVDLGEALLDGRLHFFVAHLVARRRFWLGRGVVAMNAAWLGEWNLGPKGHPDDGLLDITEGQLPAGELLMARHRARTGTHVPHPGLKVSRVPAAQVHFEKPVVVRLDGRPVGSFRDVSVRVAADALTVVV
jgi:hypothetical protein